MVSSVINPKGTGRSNEMLRIDEYIFFLWFGNAQLGVFESDDEEEEDVFWETMRRRNLASRRGRQGKGACGPNQFYPIYVDQETGFIKKIGDPLPTSTLIEDAPQEKGCETVFPIRPDGTEMNWSLTYDTCKLRLKKGYVRAGRHEPNRNQRYIIQYLPAGAINAIESGEAEITNRNDDGSLEAKYVIPKYRTPSTQWNFKSHYAEHNGTNLLKTILPGRSFPFPKSLYAVEDALRLFLHGNKEAIVLDFFAGSGTTSHAVMRLNHQDNGARQCISITNNEVSADEQIKLYKDGLRQGDKDWEKWGICDYITKPRIKAIILGETPDGNAIEGAYKFTDEFPLSEGFSENAEFFTLTYHTPIAINHNLAFKQIASLLWLRAGSVGNRIDEIPDKGWELVESYGLLIDLDKSSEFIDSVNSSSTVKMVYIVTNDDRCFQSVVHRLHSIIESVRLYESYLKNFQFTSES